MAIETAALPSQDELMALFSYYPSSGRLVWKERPLRPGMEWWNTRYAGKGAGHVHTNKHGHQDLQVLLNGKRRAAHRIIYKLMTDEEPELIDHVNGDSLDNRWNNLRSVSHIESNKNMPRQKNNTSGVTGVHWAKRDQRWYAKIKIGGTQRGLGTYRDFEDAVAARKAAEQQHGFHANHGQRMQGEGLEMRSV